VRTLRLTLAYDGTDFEGWQLQPERRTVQGEIEAALASLCGRPLRPNAAGRTDSGVHAAGQVLSLKLPDEVTLPPKAFVNGLNGLLPEDVAVLAAEEVAEDFDARRDASGKHYRYRLLNRRTRHPLCRRTHWVVFQPLAVEAMRAAAVHFVGEHDFSAFRASDCQSKTAVRKLHRVALTAGEGGELCFDIEGTAFLKHMVRNIVGTLVEVGREKVAPEAIPELIAGRDRTRSGPTAPALGLTLVSVRYEGRRE
jgi:tRNA pseudouridine38-40 synthase